MLTRIGQVIEGILTKSQFGFKKEKNIREAILTLRRVIEKKATFIASVDLGKPFNNVKWNNMLKTLKRIRVTYKYRRIIKNFVKT